MKLFLILQIVLMVGCRSSEGRKATISDTKASCDETLNFSQNTLPATEDELTHWIIENRKVLAEVEPKHIEKFFNCLNQ